MIDPSSSEEDSDEEHGGLHTGHHPGGHHHTGHRHHPQVKVTLKLNKSIRNEQKKIRFSIRLKLPHITITHIPQIRGPVVWRFQTIQWLYQDHCHHPVHYLRKPLVIV